MASLCVEAVISVGKTLDGFAILVSVSNTNGEPVAGLTQAEFSIDTLAGNVNLSEANVRFLSPKSGFYMFIVTPSAALEKDTSHAVSISVVRPVPAGGTDNGQTLAAARI